MPFQVSVDWGERSRLRRLALFPKSSGTSFWLTPATGPVRIGIVKPEDIASWDTAAVIALPVTTSIASQVATVDLGTDLHHIRLDFELSATVAGQTAVVVEFRQLFLVTSMAAGQIGQNGILLPSQFSIRNIVLARSPKGPVAAKGTSQGRRRFLGLHPLLEPAGISKLSINLEFVDVTELWWKIHPDNVWGWYFHPDLNGRQEHLRVLAWTAGGDPMLWFAVLPDASVSLSQSATLSNQKPDAPSPPADIVFFRPFAGVNSFVYTPDAKGFEASKHQDTTLGILARYLLSPVSESRLGGLSALRAAELLTDRVQPKSRNPITPADPMSLMKLFDAQKQVRSEAFTQGLPNAFRPVALEAALNRSGNAHVLLLPLGFDAFEAKPAGGYDGALQPGLKGTVNSALKILWNANAFGRGISSVPEFTNRELWLAGHSAGNRSLWTGLKANASEVARIVSFDADTIAQGMNIMGLAGEAQKKQGKVLNAFVITTPSSTGDKNGLTDLLDVELRKLRAKGTFVTVLPDYPKRTTYWQLPPTAITNAFVFDLLRNWIDAAAADPEKLLKDSAKSPQSWNFLFFHELAVFGGDLMTNSASTTTAGATSSFVRTFFEMALGAPNPRPSWP